MGAHFNLTIPKDASRTAILLQLSTTTLGKIGASFLSVLVALACFTTAVGIITGIADYFRGFFNNSKFSYRLTAVIGCLFGVLVGQFDVHFIIDAAIPVLLVIYPVTIVLIILNVLPDKWASKSIFQSVVYIAILFSFTDVLNLYYQDTLVMQSITKHIPLAESGLAWVLPSLIVLVFINLKKNR